MSDTPESDAALCNPRTMSPDVCYVRHSVAAKLESERDNARAMLSVARIYIERMAIPNDTEWLLTRATQEAQGVLAQLDQIGKEAND